MKLPVIDQAIAVATRRCPTPSDLSVVTHLGDEAGDGDEADRVWALVEDVYRTGMHPGIQVCIRQHNQVVLDRSIGHAHGIVPGHRFDADAAVPLTPDSPVNLFSAAKAVTGMMMHKLDEMGAISLDDPIADHVPGFDKHGKGDITIRNVIEHRAGLARMPGEAFDLDLLDDPDAIEQILCDLKPSSAPGEGPHYHAITGGFLMESVTRHATGRSLRDVLATEVKAPLGLEWFDYGVSLDDVHLVADNVETGVPMGPLMGMFLKRILGKGWSEVLRMSNDPRFLTAVVPSGNIIVRARDAAIFYQCVMDGGKYGRRRVFKKKTIERALHPPHDEPVFDKLLGFPVMYGGGFMLGNVSFSPWGWNRPGAFGHVGMSNLFTWADRDRDLVVIILTTGKPMIGPHLPPFVKMITGINQIFPAPESAPEPA